MDLELAGRRALVTGGTKGIGRAIAAELLTEGVSVAFCARNADEVKQAEAALREEGREEATGRLSRSTASRPT